MTTKIFVGNLSWHTDERTLKNVFASAGPVKFVKVIRDRSTNISKGFAFVTFKEAEAVSVAIEQFHEFVVDGKPIQVTIAEEPKASAPKESAPKAGAHKAPAANAEAPDQAAATPEEPAAESTAKATTENAPAASSIADGANEGAAPKPKTESTPLS